MATDNRDNAHDGLEQEHAEQPDLAEPHGDGKSCGDIERGAGHGRRQQSPPEVEDANGQNRRDEAGANEFGDSEEPPVGEYCSNHRNDGPGDADALGPRSACRRLPGLRRLLSAAGRW